jgi:hypothetical protein
MGKMENEEVCRNRARARHKRDPVVSCMEGFSKKRVIWLCGSGTKVWEDDDGELEEDGGYE